MKTFEDEKEVINYLGVTEQYFEDSLNSFLQNQGSEIFEPSEDITYDKFKYNGFNIESDNGEVEIFVASVPIDENDFKYYYCIQE